MDLTTNISDQYLLQSSLKFFKRFDYVGAEEDDIICDDVKDNLLGIDDETAKFQIIAKLKTRASELKIASIFNKWIKSIEDENSKELLDIETLKVLLENRYNIEVKFNEISHENEIVGEPKEFITNPTANLLPIILNSILRKEFKGVNENLLAGFLDVISASNRYNPVIEYFERIKDENNIEHSELNKVYEILGITSEDDCDKFSRLLVYKWLVQCVAMAFNGYNEKEYSSDGALVLKGEQGLGKTSFFERLCSFDTKYFGNGEVLVPSDKDSVIQVTSKWICELGEIDSTFKRDVAILKAFMTRTKDEYRAAYARCFVKTFRRVSFCGSCNKDEFLVDDTGNRRWWVVEVNHIDLDKLRTLNVDKLWSEIYNDYEREKDTYSQGFRLTPAERAELNKRNSAYEVPLPAMDEILSCIAIAEADYEDHLNLSKYIEKYVTTNQFMEAWGNTFNKYTANKVSKALQKLGYIQTKKRIDGSPLRAWLIWIPKRENQYNYY